MPDDSHPGSALLISRELSLLAFNRRVLALAQRKDIPVLERLRFLAIVGNNLDEFFEIRVAGIRSALRSGTPPRGATLHEVRTSYASICEAAHAPVRRARRHAACR